MTRWVVVGGGSAGCVVAARLSERVDHEVILLEAGPDHDASHDDDVGAYLTDATRLRSDMVFRRPGDPAVPYARGHGLAGSSLINGGVVTGSDAPTGHLMPLQEPWADGAVGGALLASEPVARRVRLIRRNDRRVTAADAYLRPVMHRSNLRVETAADVRRVVFDGRRVVGIVESDGSLVEADRVVVCAGAIHSPAILLRSGVDTPGVGEGLQDHPAFTIGLRLRAGRAPAREPAISVVADHPRHQVLAINHIDGASDMGALMVALVDGRARGRVRLSDAEEPIVELDQLGDDRDSDALADAVTETAGLLARPAWSEVVDRAYADDVGTPLGSITGSHEQTRSWIAGHLGGYFHASATCAEGVVTDNGSVRGYAGLYVADASALSTVPRHDLYLHVITNADRLATTW